MEASLVLSKNFDNIFDKKIEKEIKKYVKSKVISLIPQIKLELQKSFFKVVEQSIEYQSIVKDFNLAGELGITNIDYALNAILHVWSSNIVIKFIQTKGKFGTLSIQMINDDYSDVLSLSEATIIYQSSKSDGRLEWLRWLLLEGGNTIISEYEFQPDRGMGRTGFGIMVQKTGGGWSVPSEYAGTANDNFITRALSNFNLEIEQALSKVFKGL